MYWWLESLLNFHITKRIGKDSESEFLGGILETSEGKIKVIRGIPLIMPKRISRQVRKIFTAYQQIPPSHWRASKSDWIRYLRERHKNLLLMALMLLGARKRVNVLALGCGWGWEIWLLRKVFSNVNIDSLFVGCDISLRPLFIAKKISKLVMANNVDFVCCPAEYLPFKDNSFDIVTAIFGPLDHSINFWHVFKEVNRVLSQEGIFVGTVLNRFALDWIFKVISQPKLFKKTLKYANHLHARIRIPVGSRYVRIPTHFYNIFELKGLLAKYSFKIVRLEALFSFLPLNFKKTKFGIKEKILKFLDMYAATMPIFRGLGRYIGFIAKKKNTL